MSLATFRNSIARERYIRLFFFFSALLLLMFSIVYISNLMVSFILAFTSYYLLSPSVDYLERRGLPRTLAAALPFVVVSVGLYIIIQIFFPVLATQANDLKENAPRFMDSGILFLERLEGRVNSILADVYPIDLRQRLEAPLLNMMKTAMESVPSFLSKSVTVLILAPFLTYFMLLDGRQFLRSILSLVPNNLFELALHLNYQIGTQMGGFIRARIVQSVLVGLVVYVGLKFIGFPYALMLALFAGLINVIPYLGPVIGFIPALLINFSNPAEAQVLLPLLIVYGIAQAVDSAIITPFVVAKIIDLHPVTVVLVVIVGAQAMGILGMIICIPIFCALKVSTYALYRHFTDFRA